MAKPILISVVLASVLCGNFAIASQANSRIITCTIKSVYGISESSDSVSRKPGFESELIGRNLLFDSSNGNLTVCWKSSGCSVAWHGMKVFHDGINSGTSFMAHIIKPANSEKHLVRTTFASLKIAFWEDQNPFTYIVDGWLLMKGHCYSNE